ncbi:ankyrin repeat domain-containing protein [Catenovulum maritimum]|uniref:Uncharacterized protein n=1 Tax=Catenovulum maritimum TaxID=1513271 RepID=A0A0J8GRQ5_9ALTE|nr:ankyrin repeat domain-containing protein [Catenovulum maritimum]KMT65495.1 hypothetical protein XM47_09090 [Catenovulum maritimum]
MIRHCILSILIVTLLGCGPKPWDEPELHEAAIRGDIEKVQRILKQGVDVDSLNSQGATALHWAAFKGQKGVAKLLIEQGADVNAKTTKGSTPLRLATTHKQTEVISFLKSKGATLD